MGIGVDLPTPAGTPASSSRLPDQAAGRVGELREGGPARRSDVPLHWPACGPAPADTTLHR